MHECAAECTPVPAARADATHHRFLRLSHLPRARAPVRSLPGI